MANEDSNVDRMESQIQGGTGERMGDGERIPEQADAFRSLAAAIALVSQIMGQRPVRLEVATWE